MKKGGRFDYASKLAPRTSVLFSARFTRTITLCVIGLPSLLDGCTRGGAVSLRRNEQVERTRVATRSPARFSAEKRRHPPHNPTQRQSGRRSRPGLRSKRKKNGEDHGIELNRIPEILRPFSYILPRLKPQPINRLDWFFGTFLTQESTVLPSSPPYSCRVTLSDK